MIDTRDNGRGEQNIQHDWKRPRAGLTPLTAALTGAGLLLGAALMARGIRRHRAIDLQGRSVLITGGSRGLGLLLARELGRQGARLTLAARDEDELERARLELRAAGVEVSTIVADIATEAAAERMVGAVVSRYGGLDVLVNNAGVMTVGPLDHTTLADYEQAMAVHFWGPLFAMRAAIPHMRSQGGGRIVNISSIGGAIGVPHLVPYCASKFALTGLSSAAGAELAADKILVTTVLPGLMRTGSPFNAWFKGQHREEFAWFAIFGSTPVFSIDGRRAAARIVDALRHGDAELIITWPARLAVLANAAAPAIFNLAMSLASRLLPQSVTSGGDVAHSGWQSGSRWAPSFLTRLSERAAVANNELPADSARAREAS